MKEFIQHFNLTTLDLKRGKASTEPNGILKLPRMNIVNFSISFFLSSPNFFYAKSKHIYQFNMQVLPAMMRTNPRQKKKKITAEKKTKKTVDKIPASCPQIG